MKKVLTSVCGGAVLVVLLAGCDPHLAQIPSGTQEELWYRQLKSNYSSFTPPRHPAPAAYAPNWNNNRQNGAGVPADDPERAVDSAADGGKVVNVEDAAPAKETKAADGEKKEAAVTPEPEVKKTDDAGEKKIDTAEGKTPEAESKFYVVQSGDTLGGIAKKFYGKASLEDVIFRANSKVLKDRNTLSVGMRLVIPEL